jgi:hypothetical protein
VFVTGCHRSGTNLLYDNLLSAGGFAIYRGYLPVYETLIPRFGSLKKLVSRKQIVDTWLRSKGFARSGLEAEKLASQLVANCRTGGDFISITMDAIANRQGVDRWAAYNPDNLLYLPLIKAEIPNALFVHMVRDGRDIALSLMKMGGFTPFAWSGAARGLEETALYWEWTVRKGRRYGRLIQDDYIEVHYEDLVADPSSTLAKLSEFLDHDLNYERIRNERLGRLRETNSSFRGETTSEPQSPVNRWKQRLSSHEITALESLVGECLIEFGYPLTSFAEPPRLNLWQTGLGATYHHFLDTKLWLKQHTRFGRLADLSVLELTEEIQG